MSAGEEAEVWQRWKRGELCPDIGRALDRDRSAIYYVVAARGGIPPPPRTRSRRGLRVTEREEISRGLARGDSLRQIGRRVGRAPSTVSREVRRHGGRTRYRAAVADTRAWARARRPKPCRLAGSVVLRTLVATKLARNWSPQQIAGWLTQTFPDDPGLHVSHETIYRSLFVQSRGVLKRELIAHLRRRHRVRRARQVTTARHRNERIPDAVSIRERPAEVADRGGPGPLGRQPADGGPSLLHRDARRTPVALRAVGAAGGERHHDHRPRPAHRVDGLAHLGSGERARGAQTIHRGHERPGLLLRPAEFVAARHEREHQRLAAPVLPEGDGPLAAHPGGSGCGRATAQHPSPQDSGIRYAS